MSSFLSKKFKNEEVPWFLEDGIRRYGRKAGEVQLTDLLEIAVTPEALMHVTRHLVGVSQEARANLLGLMVKDGENEWKVDNDFIDVELSVAGSKFNSKINDPAKIIDFTKQWFIEAVRAGKKMFWIENPVTGKEEAEILMTVTPEMKTNLSLKSDESFGNCGVVFITPEIAPIVKQEARGQGEEADRILVNVVRGFELPGTDQLIVRLARDSAKDPVVFCTTFTGIKAPRIPCLGEQDIEEFDYNTGWWSQRAFVK